MNRSLALALICLLVPGLAIARGNSGGQHELSVAAGIAMPSAATSVFENPAGLIFNNRLRLSVQGKLDSPNQLRGAIFTGNGGSAAMAGAGSAHDGHAMDGYFGAGTLLGSSIALGVAGFTSLESKPTLSSMSFNAGILMGAGSGTTLGVVARSVNDGVSEWGAGLSYQASGSTYLVLDSSFNSSFDDLAFQPGILLNAGGTSLMFSYGLKASGQLHEGFSAGLSFLAGRATSCQIYYQHLSEYYAAVTFGL